VPPTTRRSPALYACLIALAAIASYGNSLSNPFVFDDRYAIVENASLRSPAQAMAQPRNTPLAARPLVALTFALNYQLGGLEVGGYHAANIAIHLCTALLLFGVVRRTLLTPRLRTEYGGRDRELAFAIALVWVVHPLGSEAVDYLTQRTESLMAVMCLLTLYAGVRSLDEGGWGRWHSTAVVACALGMASKESMVVAPLLVVLYDRTFAFDGVGEALRKRWHLYTGLALTWLVLAFLNLSGPRSGSAGFATGVDPLTYLMNQAVMITRYLRLTLWPTSLVINYGTPAPLTIDQVLPQAALVAALLILLVIALVRWPMAGHLGAWIALTLAPTSSVIPIATEVGAERRMYLPLMAAVAAAVLAVHRIASRRVAPRVQAAALVGVAVALGVTTCARNREYASALTLAQTTLARWPTPAAHGLVGTELATLGRDDEALPELRLGAPADPRARYHLVTTLFNRKEYEAAVRELETLAREHPLREEVPLARRVIGQIYAVQRRWPDAVAQFRLVLSMVPSDQTTKRLLIQALMDQGIALGRAGQPPEAIASLREAVELDPSNATARQNLATALLDSGDPAGAIDEARRAVATGGANAAAYDLIGRALALQGRYDEAVEHLQRALALSPGDADFQDDLRQVLAVRAGSKRGAVK
jgi:tetratricopeptide (TPR) repeat protein